MSDEMEDRYAAAFEVYKKLGLKEKQEVIARGLDIKDGKEVPAVPFHQWTPESRSGYINTVLDQEFYSGLLTEALFKGLARKQAEEYIEEHANGSGALRLITDKDVRALPEPEWWIEGLIQKGTIVELAGPGGIGKSLLAIHITRALALGYPFWGRTTQRARTLYVAAEGASAFGARTRAWDDRYHGRPADDAIGYLTDGVTLSSRSSMERLRDLVKAEEYDLIILDTFSQLSGIDNENDAAKSAQVFRHLKMIREVRDGATVIVIHHTNAQGTARGSTVHRNNVDTMIIAKGNSDGYSLSTRDKDGGKQKDGEGLLMQGFKVVSHLTSAVVENDGKAPVSPWWVPIKSLLDDGDWHEGADLRAACGIEESKGKDYDSFKTFMASLTNDKTVERKGSNRYSYRLMPLAI